MTLAAVQPTSPRRPSTNLPPLPWPGSGSALDVPCVPLGVDLLGQSGPCMTLIGCTI